MSVMKRCPEERSGTTPAPQYIDIINDQRVSPEEHAKLPEDIKISFEYAPDIMDKCLACPLVNLCQGRARFQTSDSILLTTIDDVIQKVIENPHEWSLSQLMSLQASSSLLVLHEFEKSLHQPGWNVMWERLTGEVSKELVTRQQFIKKCIELGLTFLGGVDWGYTNPATCIVVAIDSRDNVFVLEAHGATGKDDPEWVQFIQDNVVPIYPMESFMPDTENPSGIQLMKKTERMHVREIDKGKGSVKRGINVIKKLMRVPGKNRYTKIFFAPDLPEPETFPGMIKEMGLYEKKINLATGKPIDSEYVDAHNHHIDALRYPLDWYFSKNKAQMHMLGGDPEPKNERDKLLQQAAKVGNFSYVDNREEADKKKDDKDPKGGGSGGGMKWAWT